MRHEQARYYYNNSGEYADCYTVVYSHSIKLAPFHVSYPYASMSEHPTAPNGFWQHGTQQGSPIDNWGNHNNWGMGYASRKQLGKRVTWSLLPQEIRTALEQGAAQ